jgi:hypothetical protein
MTNKLHCNNPDVTTPYDTVPDSNSSSESSYQGPTDHQNEG